MRGQVLGLLALLVVIAHQPPPAPHEATPVKELQRFVVFGDEVPPAPDDFNAAAARTFNVTARQFTFNFGAPAVVNQGDEVTLQITSSDVEHGFFLEHYMPSSNGVNLPPGETKTVSFVANTPGTFTFFCTISCGIGHGTMNGTFTVNAVDTPQPAPTIASFAPLSGPVAGGNVVVINGTDFRNGARVFFDATEAVGVNVDSATRITAFAPARSAGRATITVRNTDDRSATAAALYSYERPSTTPSKRRRATGRN